MGPTFPLEPTQNPSRWKIFTARTCYPSLPVICTLRLAPTSVLFLSRSNPILKPRGEGEDSLSISLRVLIFGFIFVVVWSVLAVALGTGRDLWTSDGHRASKSASKSKRSLSKHVPIASNPRRVFGREWRGIGIRPWFSQLYGTPISSSLRSLEICDKNPALSLSHSRYLRFSSDFKDSRSCKDDDDIAVVTLLLLSFLSICAN